MNREDALAQALSLLDSFAGEGVGHVYGNGQQIFADDVCVELIAALEISAALCSKCTKAITTVSRTVTPATFCATPPKGGLGDA